MALSLEKPTLFLPIESPKRELDYKLNLARHFCKAGFDVILGNPPYIRDELKYKNYRGVFLEKGVNPDPAYYKHLMQKGIYLYDLSDEGATNPVYAITHEPAIKSLHCMRKIFLWGSNQKVDLISRNPNSGLENKYIIMGTPAFDLSTARYKSFYQALKIKTLPQSYILVNTNFGCFMGYSLKEQLKACSLISPTTLKLFKDSYQEEKTHFIDFKGILEELIISYPNEQFLIRPHPVEIQEKYDEIFKHYPNVTISKKGDINQAMSGAKIILHKDCTTAMQGYLTSIPVLSLQKGNSHSSHKWALAFGEVPQTLEEAKEMIDYLLKNKKWDSKTQSKIDQQAHKKLKDYFHNIGTSTKEFVDFIVKDAKPLL